MYIQFDEYLLAEVILPDKVSPTLGGIYRSPSANKAVSTKLLTDFIQRVCDAQPSHLLLVGNFNYSDINWKSLTINDSSSPQPYEEFLEVISSCALYQHVSEPTRYKQGVAPSLLDLMITNKEGMISNLSYLPLLGKSDHLCLQFSFNLVLPDVSDYVKFNLSAGNYDTLRSEVANINCEEMMDMSMDAAWKYFSTKFDVAIKHSVPLTRCQPKFKNIYTNKDVMQLSKRRGHFRVNIVTLTALWTMIGLLKYIMIFVV